MLCLEYSINFSQPLETSYETQSYATKRPVEEDTDGYGGQTKKMRLEAGEGPQTLLRILVNSKVKNAFLRFTYRQPSRCCMCIVFQRDWVASL